MKNNIITFISATLTIISWLISPFLWKYMEEFYGDTYPILPTCLGAILPVIPFIYVCYLLIERPYDKK